MDGDSTESRIARYEVNLKQQLGSQPIQKIDPITMKIGPIGKTILCLGFRNVKDGSPFIFPFPDIGNNIFPHHWFSSSGMLTEHMYVNRHASD